MLIPKKLTIDMFEEFMFQTIEEKHGHDPYKKMLVVFLTNRIEKKDKKFFDSEDFLLYSKYIDFNSDALRKLCKLAIDNHKKLAKGINDAGYI